MATLDDEQPDPGLVPFHNDAELLSALQHKDPEALNYVIHTYSPTLTQAAWLNLNHRQDAEDVVQRVMIQLWEKAGSIRSSTSLRSWLFATLFNQCRKEKRSWIRRLNREWRAFQLKSQTISDTESSRVDDDLEVLRQAMASLPETAREIIIIRYLQELSVAESAQILMIPQGTVKSRSHEAMKLLKEKMGVQDES